LARPLASTCWRCGRGGDGDLLHVLSGSGHQVLALDPDKPSELRGGREKLQELRAAPSIVGSPRSSALDEKYLRVVD
jgi:hypothetical protein